MNLRRHVRRLSITMIAISCALVVAQAQTLDPAAKPDRGTGGNGSFALSDIENVNLTNGNVSLSIPLASLPPIAGGKLSWSIRANYNSKLWDMKSFKMQPDANHTQPWEYYVEQRSDSGGWLVSGAYWIEELFADYDAEVDCGQCAPDDFACLSLQAQCQAAFAYRYKMVLHTPDGSTHELRALDGHPYTGVGNQTWRRGFYSDYGPGPSPRFYSYDGSFIWAAFNPGNGVVWAVYMPDGTKISAFSDHQEIEDTNGNKIAITGTTNFTTGDTSTICTDVQTGRQIKYNFTAATNTGQVQYQKVAPGGWETITINFANKTLTGKAVGAGDRICTDWGTMLGGDTVNGDFQVVASIVLPQTEPGITRQIGFQYNSDAIDTFDPPIEFRSYCGNPVQYISSASHGLGELSQITLPSGAVAQYVYGLDGAVLAQGRLAPRLVPGNKLQQKRLIHDGVPDDLWNYSINHLSGQVSGPDGLLVKEDFFQRESEYGASTGGTTGFEGLVYRTTQTKASNNQNVTIQERRWAMKKFDGAFDEAPNGVVAFNPLVTAEFTTLCDSSGNPSQMSAKKFQYDFNGNQTSVTEYDFFNPNSVTRDSNGVPVDVPAGVSAVRSTVTNFYNGAPSASSSTVYAKRVVGSPTPIINAPSFTAVGSSQTEFHYDSVDNTPPTKGNLTKMRRWEGTKWISTTHTYDPANGNLLTTTDPNNNVTTFVYGDATHAGPTSMTVDPDRNVSGDELVTLTSYDFSTGLPLTQTDVNNKVTSFDYTNQRTNAIDPFGRVGIVTGPAVSSSFFDSGGNFTTLANQQRKVVTRYFDSVNLPNNASQIEVSTDLRQQGDGLLKVRKTSDQLGRPVLAESSENGSSYTISSRTVYQQMGRITFSSNPTRNTGESTDGWTRATKDDAGRVIEVASFSGATQPPPTGTPANWTGSVLTSYNAEQTTVIDQAGKQRRSFIDGLGRLKQVDELLETGALYASTTYSYDALGNLLFVNQGAQQRQFVYDSLSRLREAYNPEQVNGSGVKIKTAYQYDDASNLTLKTNPSGSTVSFTYDGLNRAKTKALSTGGVWTYTYDVGTNFKGRMVSEVLQGSTDGNYYDGYDAAGRITSSHQITTAAGAAQSYSMSYKYDLAGDLTSQTYPSNKEYRTNFDNAGRVASISRYISNALDKTYASQFSYAAHGATRAVQLGNTKWEHTLFNSRLQPTEIGLGAFNGDSGVVKFEYFYGVRTGSVLDPTKNNGDIESHTITAPLTSGGTMAITQSFTYDPLNRLLTASETGAAWSQNYAYDQYGNRALSGYIVPGNESLTPRLTSDFQAATNRIVACNYDPSGNVIADQAGRGFTYDSENHQLTFNTTVGQYSYDCDGRRVKKIDANGTTVFVYNASSQLIAEYVTGAPSNGGTSYLTTDHLGSTRVVTKQDGSVKARYDYLPFGEGIPSTIGSRGSIGGYGGADSTRQKFTQKERDGESGLDYFLARYYSSAQGRFTSADQPFVGQHQGDPQSWNLFCYGRNNPLLYLDPTGEDYVLYQYDEDGKLINTYQVRDIAALGKGYTVYGQAENGDLYVHGPKDANGNVPSFTARYVEGDAGGVNVQAQYNISALGDAVGAELDRSAQGSRNLIGGFAVVTYGTGAAIGAGVFYAPAVVEAARRIANELAKTACFIAGTEVLTSDGMKAIENVVPGDVVLSSDPSSSDKEYLSRQKVRDVFVRVSPVVLDICLGTNVITCTPEHPFWVPGKGWVRAREIQPGYLLLTKDNSTEMVDSVVRREGSFTVYNFEVDRIHTYFVSSLGVLVHNDCGPNLTDKVGKIASKLGRSQQEIKDAIHAVKNNLPRGGPVRNPDVFVDTVTGEVYPKVAGGGLGDSIGNIFDYLK